MIDNSLFQDELFLRLPDTEKIKVINHLLKKDEAYISLPPEEQARVKQFFIDKISGGVSKPVQKLAEWKYTGIDVKQAQKVPWVKTTEQQEKPEPFIKLYAREVFKPSIPESQMSKVEQLGRLEAKALLNVAPYFLSFGATAPLSTAVRTGLVAKGMPTLARFVAPMTHYATAFGLSGAVKSLVKSAYEQKTPQEGIENAVRDFTKEAITSLPFGVAGGIVSKVARPVVISTKAVLDEWVNDGKITKEEIPNLLLGMGIYASMSLLMDKTIPATLKQRAKADLAKETSEAIRRYNPSISQQEADLFGQMAARKIELEALYKNKPPVKTLEDALVFIQKNNPKLNFNVPQLTSGMEKAIDVISQLSLPPATTPIETPKIPIPPTTLPETQPIPLSGRPLTEAEQKQIDLQNKLKEIDKQFENKQKKLNKYSLWAYAKGKISPESVEALGYKIKDLEEEGIPRLFWKKGGAGIDKWIQENRYLITGSEGDTDEVKLVDNFISSLIQERQGKIVSIPHVEAFIDLQTEKETLKEEIRRQYGQEAEAIIPEIEKEVDNIPNNEIVAITNEPTEEDIKAVANELTDPEIAFIKNALANNQEVPPIFRKALEVREQLTPAPEQVQERAITQPVEPKKRGRPKKTQPPITEQPAPPIEQEVKQPETPPISPETQKEIADYSDYIQQKYKLSPELSDQIATEYITKDKKEWSDITRKIRLKEEMEARDQQIKDSTGYTPAEKDTEGYIDLEEGTGVGLGVKKVFTAGNIEVEQSPKDLTGIKGLLRNFLHTWYISELHPTAEDIAREGRDAISKYQNEADEYFSRIAVWKKLTPKEKEIVVDAIEGKVPETTLNDRQKEAYNVAKQIFDEMLKVFENDFKIATEKFGVPKDKYFPHIFVGSYRIKVNGHTVGFAETLEDALKTAHHYIKENPNNKVYIAPKEFNNDITTTLLTRKGFWRFINEITKQTTLDKEEILDMMKGVAGIRPRPKFVGSLKPRILNLEGYLKDERALYIYINSILRKKYLEPFDKWATDKLSELPPALKSHFTDYIKAVSGKFDPYDPKRELQRISSKLTKAQSFLKLGYRPITAFVNRLQPLHMAYPELGEYLFKGMAFAKTPEGRKVIEESGVPGLLPKYFSGENIVYKKPSIGHPLGMFSRTETQNRQDVICGGYLLARDIFDMPREVAIKRGYDYILKFLEEFKDPHISALEYAKQLDTMINSRFDVSDLPAVYRHPIGRVAFQYKSYPINFIEVSSKWIKEAVVNPTPHNINRVIRMFVMNILLGGVRAVPFVGRTLWKFVMTSFPFILLHPKLRQTIGRGVFSALGIDLSKRVGPNDFLPKELEDALGPTGKDLYNCARFLKGEITAKEFLMSISVAGRSIYQAIESSEGSAVDVYSRERNIAEINNFQRILMAMGFPITDVEVSKDMQVLINDAIRQYKQRKAIYVDMCIERMEAGESFSDVLEKAQEEGISITPADINRERKYKKQTTRERTMRTIPRDIREELGEEMNLLQGGEE